MLREEIENTLLTKSVRTDEELLLLISREILARREKELFGRFLVHDMRKVGGGGLAARQSNLR